MSFGETDTGFWEIENSGTKQTWSIIEAEIPANNPG